MKLLTLPAFPMTALPILLWLTATPCRSEFFFEFPLVPRLTVLDLLYIAARFTLLESPRVYDLLPTGSFAAEKPSLMALLETLSVAAWRMPPLLLVDWSNSFCIMFYWETRFKFCMRLLLWWCFGCCVSWMASALEPLYCSGTPLIFFMCLLWC